MGENMNLWMQIEWGSLLLFTSVMTMFLTYVMVNSKHSRMRVYYCLMHMTTIAIMVINYATTISSDGLVRTILISVLGTVALFYDGLFVFYPRIWLKRNTQTIITALFGAYFVSGVMVILTNSLHHMYITVQPDGQVTYGILFYAYIVAGFVIESASILFLAFFWVKKLDNQKYRTALAAVGVLAIAFAHFSLLRIQTDTVDLYPLGILAIFTFFFIGAGRFSMFDAISYTSRYGLELFTDAIIIMDQKGRVLYQNSACELLGSKTVQAILQRMPKDKNRKKRDEKELVEEIDLQCEDTVRFFTVIMKPVKKRHFSTPKKIYLIHDNTQNVIAINTLAEKNQYLKEMYDSVRHLTEDSQKLAILTERNVLAQEIHDVVGHNLILVLNTMESNRMLHDRVVAMRRIKQAVAEIDESIREIENESNDELILGRNIQERESVDFDEFNSGFLPEKLQSLVERLSGSGIQLEINGSDTSDMLPENVVGNVYRICQESVTNAIKHGRATSITISFKKKKGHIEIFIIDNGVGCSQIVKGTGLSGMEERVRNMRGDIKFSSFGDQEGFMVRAAIPI